LLIAAGGLDHHRPLLEKGQQWFGAAPEFADEARSLDVGLDLGMAEAVHRVRQALFEDIGNRGEAAIERLPPDLRLRLRHLPLAGIGDGTKSGRHDLLSEKV
jgi:hypothetical protein